MYGLINKAIKALVCSSYGEKHWNKLHKAANVDNDFFIGIEMYPDKLTYDLVSQAPDILGISSEAFLKEIGEYWVYYVGEGDCSYIFNLAGNNFVSFLESLNAIHSRASVLFPALTPPTFPCVDIEATSLRLEDYSKRKGLAPMVIGMMQGLGRWFDTRVDIQQEKCKTSDAGCDVFFIKFCPNTGDNI